MPSTLAARPRPGGGRRAGVTVAVLAVLGLLLAGSCSGSDRSDTGAAPDTAAPDPATTEAATRPGRADDPTPAPLDWSPCHDGFECADLIVPIDYGDPTGASIDLAVVRSPVAATDERVGALVVNPGGPGGSGVDMVLNGYGAGLDRHLDIVGWDPRGTNRSSQLDCARSPAAFLALDSGPDDPAEQEALDRAAQAIADDCAQHAGPLLDHLDTDTNARDLEQLRLALGGDPLTYAGYSYGTAIGLAYADRYPTHIRAMVLDGVVQPDQALPEALLGQAVAFEAQLERTFAACDASRTCPVTGAAAAWDRLSATVERRPLPLDDGRSFGPSDLAIASAESTYAPAFTQPFLEGLADASRGDGRLLMALADEYRQSGDFAGYLGVVCVDSPHPVGAAEWRAFADRLKAAAPRMGAAVANEVLSCASWPAPVTGRPRVIEAAGAPPIVVVGTTRDPATPYAQAQAVADQLASGTLITYEGDGHTSGGQSRCVDEAVEQYLIGLQPPPAGLVCRS